MKVLDGGASNYFSVIPCSGTISEDQQKKALFPLESDLVVLRLAVRDGGGCGYVQSSRQYGEAYFGVVEKADVKAVESSRRVSLDSIGEDDLSGGREFQLTLNVKTSAKFRPVRNCFLQVEYVSSLLTALRQFCGLMQFSRSPLATDILKPRQAVNFCSGDYQQSSLVSKDYNQSQEKVISTAANAIHKEFPLPRICLVQGPPGTGKSYTIVGLVKEIFKRPQNVPTQTSGLPSSGPLSEKLRILLCAPSNGAIDELISQIARARIRLNKQQDDKGKGTRNRNSAVKEAVSKNCGDLSLVRVGRKSHIHPSVMKFSLESIIKQVRDRQSVSQAGDDINSIKDNLKVCYAREKELDKEIWRLKNTPLPDNLAKLTEKHEEKAKLQHRRNELLKKYRFLRDTEAKSRREEARLRRDILRSADIICTTLSGAGSKSLKEDLQPAGRPVCPFTCVIIDEACQCTELDVLIALQHKASKLVLVGDPEQLAPTVLSVKAKENLYGRSMFQRLYKFFRHHEIGKPVLMLEEQYRMHPLIAEFPSRHVYSSRLKSHSSLAERPFPLKKHYALFDVTLGQELSKERGALWNPAEVKIIADLCGKLMKILQPERVGIITPYRKQREELKKKLHDWGVSRDGATIEVNTVDGFQGREKDVIILSCVRAKNFRGSIGFVSDRQRMNVALTRARHALYVFGHMETLKGDSRDWRALIEDAQKRDCLYPVVSARDVQSILSIGDGNNIKSSANDPRLNYQTPSARRVENANATPAPVVQNRRPRKTAGTSHRDESLRTDSSDRRSTSEDSLMSRNAVQSARNPVQNEKDRSPGWEDASRHRHHRNAEIEGRQKNKEIHDWQEEPETFANGHRYRHQDITKRPQNEHGSEERERHKHHPLNREEHQKTSRVKHDTQEYRHHGQPGLAEQGNKRPKLNDDRVRSQSPSTPHHLATATSLYNRVHREREDNCMNQSGIRVASFAKSTAITTTTGPSYSHLFANEDDVVEDATPLGSRDNDLQLASIKEYNPAHTSAFVKHQFEHEKYRRSPAATSASYSSTGSSRSPSETSTGRSAVAQSKSTPPLSRSLPPVSIPNHNVTPSDKVSQEEGSTSILSTSPPTLSTTTTATQTSRPSSSVVPQHTSWHRSEASWPSVSLSGYQTTPSFGIHEAAASTIVRQSSLSRRQDATYYQVSSSLLGRSSNGLDPQAEQAANIVRERHPPVQGPQIIPALFGHNHKRNARTTSSKEVKRLRARGTVDVPRQIKKDRNGHSRSSLKKQKAKFRENVRGRTSW